MKKISKKIVIAMGASFILTFAACGTGSPAANQPTPTPQPSPTAQPPAPTDSNVGQTPQSAIPGLPLATTSFTPGTFTATAETSGRAGDSPITVSVSFSENQITDVSVTEHNDSAYGSGWFWRAYPAVPDQILVRQSTQDIDAYTGATFTRNAIIEAVEDAIEQAGANPADLTPQFITEPLPGDKFIPGYHEITVPANTLNIEGNPWVEGSDIQRMLHSEDTDMTLRVSFGRNELHLHSGGARGLGQGDAGHGESVYPDEVRGGTWGGWWFRQVAHHQINDRQSTHVDTQTGATMAASAIVWGVEQAMIEAGANPETITPRSQPATQIVRNYSNPDARFFVPGYYQVTVPGFGGDITMTVTLDRSAIRRIVVDSHSESEQQWDIVWTDLRDLIYTEQTIDVDIDAFTGATTSANAILDGVREAMILAGEVNPNNH